MLRTTLSKLKPHGANTPNSGLDQEHSGKTRKVIMCRWTGALWLVNNKRGTTWTCFLIGRGSPDTCWLFNLTPLTIYAHFYSILMWSLWLILACLHHHLVENTRSRTCGFAGKVQVKFHHKEAFALCLGSTKYNISQLLWSEIRSGNELNFLIWNSGQECTSLVLFLKKTRELKLFIDEGFGFAWC